MNQKSLILKTLLTLFCSALLLALLWAQTDIKLSDLKNARIEYMALPRLLLCSLLVWAFRSIRVYLLYYSQIHDKSMNRWGFLLLSFQAVAIQNALLRITPLRLGEVALPMLLHRHAGIDYEQGFYRLFLLRLCEFIFLFFFLGYALLQMQVNLSSQEHIQRLLLLSALLLLLFSLKKLLLILLWLIKYIGIQSKVVDRLENSILSIHSLNKRDWYLLILSSFMILLGQYLLFDSILQCCGIHLKYFEVLIGGSISHFSNLIPIPTIGNLGTHEVGWVSAFVFVGVSQQYAVMSAIFGQWSTLFLALLWGLISYLLLQFQIKNR